VCAYCGTRNEVDLRGVHEYTVTVPESGRTCPRCGIPLQTVNLSTDKKFYIEKCDRCFGMFFDPGELDALLQETVTTSYRIDTRRLSRIATAGDASPEQVVYIKCPVCGKLMNRVNAGARSGVVMDRCRDHGVWLDGGELRRLFEWRKAGGHLYHEKVREKREERERRKENERREKSSAIMLEGGIQSLSRPVGHRRSGGAEMDLGDVVAGIARMLFG
jgi:Zn-finger nucleic acid-binding protein